MSSLDNVDMLLFISSFPNIFTPKIWHRNYTKSKKLGNPIKLLSSTKPCRFYDIHDINS